MKNFEAKCLEEAYELATAEFNCSITDLHINIIQQPSTGFLGFWKKNAIVEVSFKKHQQKDYKPKKTNFRKSNIKIQEVSKKLEESSVKTVQKKKLKLSSVPKIEGKEEIFDNFYSKDNQDHSSLVIKKDKQDIIDEVSIKLNEMFATTCYKISSIEVSFYDENTLYVEFNGEDSALLIGKEGYRYKALSYIIFNWINEKYNLMLRLEVAEFLKNQEVAIANYLAPVIETIKETGTFKTKPLDGILVHIALKNLREAFPNKYVAVKINVRGDKYVLVNEYRGKQN